VHASKISINQQKLEARGGQTGSKKRKLRAPKTVSSSSADLHLQTARIENESDAQKGEHSSSAAASLAQTASAAASRRRGEQEKRRIARHLQLRLPPRCLRLQLRRSASPRVGVRTATSSSIFAATSLLLEAERKRRTGRPRSLSTLQRGSPPWRPRGGGGDGGAADGAPGGGVLSGSAAAPSLNALAAPNRGIPRAVLL
jgi:hypothetical protein